MILSRRAGQAPAVPRIMVRTGTIEYLYPTGRRAEFPTHETALGGTQQHYLTRTLLPSHGGNTGSNPVCATTLFRRRCRGFVCFAPASEGLLQPACNPPATETDGTR